MSQMNKKRKVLDGLQLAYKVICNSVYGSMEQRQVLYIK